MCLTVKASHCQRTLWVEGNRQGHRWVCLTANCGSKVHSIRAMGDRYMCCAAYCWCCSVCQFAL